LKDPLLSFGNGIRSGMSYCGARSIGELQQKANFMMISSTSQKESGVHDIKKL
jgi:IMP dehydrogenase